MILKKQYYSKIPKVDKLLQLQGIQELIEEFPRELVIENIRQELDDIRSKIERMEIDQLTEFGENSIVTDLVHRLRERLQPNIRRCINATGIVLHTGLGRAPLSKSVQKVIWDITEGFSTVEIDLLSGKRGNRHTIIEDYVKKLTGAEAAAVVNNNAAATLLVLNTLAEERECIVSRGELITIGGSFRIPDIMKKSGAVMVEVGTTNQTWVSDYEEAINEETALLLKVHTSNYRISGFVSEVDLTELVDISKKYQLPVVHDLGSGSFLDLSQYGLPKEPVVSESIRNGADVVMFSGDKLLGGPQAGIIVGKKEYVDRIKNNQLARALRCDKITFAALEETLRLFFDPKNLVQNHAALKLLTDSLTTIKAKAEKLENVLKDVIQDYGQTGIEQGESEIGGGSLATEALPTYLVFLTMDHFGEDELSQKLRCQNPAIITRIQDKRVVFDLRTIREDEIEIIKNAVKQIIQN